MAEWNIKRAKDKELEISSLPLFQAFYGQELNVALCRNVAQGRTSSQLREHLLNAG